MRHDGGMCPRYALEDCMFVRRGQWGQSKLVMIGRVVRSSISGRSVNSGGDVIQERSSWMVRSW